MKLKRNTWMYLFFTSLLLWVGTVTFSCETPAPTTEKPEVITDAKTDPCDNISDDFRLTDSTALSRISRYDAYARATFPHLDTMNLKKGELVNPDVRYFQLPRCELDKMLKEVGPGADVKAYLAIKDVIVNKVQVQEIVVVFGDKSDTKLNWYDFMSPCPVHCKE